MLVGGGNRRPTRIMQAKLGEWRFVRGGRLGELASHQQQRLHDEGADHKRADQPTPEQAQLGASLIRSAWHTHSL